MSTANRSAVSAPSQPRVRALVVAGLAVCFAATSCVVQGSRASGMATLAEPVPRAATRGAGAIVVASADGGRETNPISRSQVSSDELKRALEMSLQRAGYLAPDSSRAGIAMRATLVSLGEPKGWLTFSVTSVVRYHAVNIPTGATMMDDTVVSVGKASLSDAFLGVTRVRLANEASIRGSLDTLLKRLPAALARGSPED